MQITLTAWVLTLVLIGCLLVLDWLLIARDPRPVTLRGAVRWSLFYVGVAMLFGVGFGLAAGWDLGSQYFAGYLVEKSLSIDNLFVFVIIITAFAVPAEQQPKALTIGILISLALRVVLIALGAQLLNSFSVMFAVFGLGLIVTAVQLYRHRDLEPSIEDNPLVRLARRRLRISSRYDGARLATREGGGRAFTPLLLALVAIGSTDLLFAFDSIPAVFGVTTHAFVVFAANAFALLGLRPLYFLVADLLSRLVYLSSGIAAVLGFIGIKLILEFAHVQWPAVPEISTLASLAVIAALLLVTGSASALRSRRDPGIHAHAGALRGRRREGRPWRRPWRRPSTAFSRPSGPGRATRSTAPDSAPGSSTASSNRVA